MMEDIIETEKQQRRRYVSSLRHTIQVDYQPYTRDIARRIGADPELQRHFFRNIKLWWALFTGPQVPYMFRLQGPHTWNGATAAILSTTDRVLEPLKTRTDVGIKRSPLRVLDKGEYTATLAVLVMTCVLMVPLLAHYLFV